jgi:hypothetical protein
MPLAPPTTIGIAMREGDPNVGKPPRDHLLHKDEFGA